MWSVIIKHIFIGFIAHICFVKSKSKIGSQLILLLFYEQLIVNLYCYYRLNNTILSIIIIKLFLLEISIIFIIHYYNN